MSKSQIYDVLLKIIQCYMSITPQWNLKVKKSTNPQWGFHSHDLNICQRPHLRDSSCYSVAQPCLNLCDPMNCSMPGFPALHYLPEYAQTQVHWVNDAIQSPHLLLPHSPPVLNVSSIRSFPWIGSSHQVAKVLELQL